MYLHIADRGEERAHHPGFFRYIIRLAFDDGFGASRRLHRCTRRAALGFGARDDGAARPGARRTFTDLARLVARADARWAGRHCRLENIAAHIGRRGAFRLEHVAAQIGLRRARRNRRLQHIFGPIDLGAAITVLLVATVLLRHSAAARARVPFADFARGLGDIYETFCEPL